MNRQIMAALLAATTLAGCSGGDPAETIEAVRHTEQTQLQSIEADELVGIARLYDDNAVLVRPDGSVLNGGEAIAEAYGDLLEDPNFALAIEPTGGWASGADDLAVLSSKVDFTTTDPATQQPVTQVLSSQTVWQRATGSTWKIVSAMNVAVPPAAPAPVQ